jgi:hypothetical protein
MVRCSLAGGDAGLERGQLSAIAVIGAGPRGLSTLERIIAHLTPADCVTVHLIDPHPPGGRVWRADQSGHLLMNTTAGDATMYLDETVQVDSPRFDGLTLFDWAQDISAHLPQDAIDEDLRAEIDAITPVTSVSRRLYGTYLGWVYGELVGRVPDGSRIETHACEAVAIERRGVREVVTLSDERAIAVDSVVLAIGHTDTEDRVPAPQSKLIYIAPGQPAEQDWSVVPRGEAVVVRGLGLNFYDTMALLTLGRGGRFAPCDDGSLTYRPSGEEPILWAGSRRGIPFKAKAITATRPTPLEMRYPPRETLARLEDARGEIDFDRDLWPWVRKEALWQTALAELRSKNPARSAELAERFDTAPRATTPDPASLRSDFGITYAFDPDRTGAPFDHVRFDDPAAFDHAIRSWIKDDLAEATLGEASIVKLGDRAIGDARAWIFPLAAYGGLEGRSHRARLEGWYAGYANSLAGGPPALRVRQLAALIDAKVVRMLGAGMRVQDAPEDVVATSATTPSRVVHARTLIEARLPDPDVERTASTLLSSLHAQKRVRPYTLPAPSGTTPLTAGGIDVTEAPFRVVDASGAADARVFALGVPVGPHVGTSFTAFARSNSAFLRQTDSVAAAALQLARVADQRENVRR